MPMIVLLRLTVEDSQCTIIGDLRRPSAPTKDQGRYTKYMRFTSIYIHDCSFNGNHFLQGSMELRTLWMMFSVFCRSYGCLRRLYMVSELMNKLCLPIWIAVWLIYQRAVYKQRSQTMPQLWVGSILTPECSRVHSRYFLRLLLSISTMAPECTMEYDHHEEIPLFGNSVQFDKMHRNERQLTCANTLHYEGSQQYNGT